MIVKVPDADYQYMEPVTIGTSTKMVGHTVISRIGEAVRLASDKHFIGASWMVTHDALRLMTDEESETIAKIFEDVSERARLRNPRKYRNK